MADRTGFQAAQLGDELREIVLAGPPPPAPSRAGVRAVEALPARPRPAEVVSAAALDPVLACAVLSAAAGARDYDGCSLRVAVADLGAADAAHALRAAAARTPPAPPPYRDLARRGWREALMVARMAQALSKLRGLDPSEGYTGGLLHDLGKCVGVAALRARAGDGPPPCDPPACETAVEALHVEAGVKYAARVGLPAGVRRVLATHHDAAAIAAGADPVLATVATADAVVERFGELVGTTERDLHAVAGLRTAAERIVMARILPGVAAAVDEVEAAATRSGPPRLSIASGAVRVTVDLGRERVACAGERFAERRLVVTSPLPLPGGRVLLATVVDDATPFAVWVSVARTWGDRAGWHSELEVVAVWGGASDAWRAFLDRHGRGAAPGTEPGDG